ncbi:hypothetical protein HPB49_010922 [Dermacentor silvarum]|uniref:Uncharacterized protein n=1 Tax=Dermacentor silvarum TaxID=543639 RepID=A0ACB8C345_DERSI|nr:hypothetical protein HPB49_010922 [Dermacentor silvarum]
MRPDRHCSIEQTATRTQDSETDRWCGEFRRKLLQTHIAGALAGDSGRVMESKYFLLHKTAAKASEPSTTASSAHWIDVTLATPHIIKHGYAWSVADDDSFWEHEFIYVVIHTGTQRREKRLTRQALDMIVMKMYKIIGEESKKQMKPVAYNKKGKSWWTPELNIQKKHVNSMRRRFQRRRDTGIRAVHKASYCAALAKFRRSIEREKDYAAKEKCTSCSKRSLFAEPFKYGFTHGKSSVMALQDLCSFIRMHRCRNTPVTLISLDFQGAFDSVWHPLVLQYFRERRCPDNLVRLLHALLTHRTVTFRSRSGAVTAEASLGSPQGSPLSPLLWNAVVDGLLRLQMPEGETIAKATDAIGRIHEWSRISKVKLNHDKTICVLFSFGKGGMEKSLPTIKIDRDSKGIKFRNAVKLLGVMIDRRLSFFDHAEHFQRKAKTLAMKYVSFLNTHAALTPMTKRQLYRQVMLPAVTYASPVWWTERPDCRLE